MFRVAQVRDGRTTFFNCLYAEHALKSKAFHDRMDDLLGPYGTVVHATLKSSHRAKSHVGSAGKLGHRDMPNAKYLPDILRVSLHVTDHATLENAHAALVAAYEPAGPCHDRRNEPPHDATQHVDFEGLVVDVRADTFSRVVPSTKR